MRTTDALLSGHRTQGDPLDGERFVARGQPVVTRYLGIYRVSRLKGHSMPFTTLGQAQYKSDNGHDIDAATVEYLAPYAHVADGFYSWECGQCKHKHSSRSCGWPISGQVLRCDKCGQMSLLVRTNCAALDEALTGLWRSKEMEDENERLKGIERFNAEQVVAMKRDVMRAVQQAVAAVDPHVPVRKADA